MAASMLGNIYGGAMAQSMGGSGLPPVSSAAPGSASSVSFSDYPNPGTSRKVLLLQNKYNMIYYVLT